MSADIASELKALRGSEPLLRQASDSKACPVRREKFVAVAQDDGWRALAKAVRGEIDTLREEDEEDKHVEEDKASRCSENDGLSSTTCSARASRRGRTAESKESP